MNLYSVEIQIAATLYVKAENAETATRMAREAAQYPNTLELQCDEVGPQEDGPSDTAFVLDLGYGDPRMPAVSMSPFVTLNGLQPAAKAELVERL